MIMEQNKIDQNEDIEDIFDKIMKLPGLRRFWDSYKKYKSVLLYLFFGGLTTLISIVTFSVCIRAYDLNEHIANTISWIAAVTFAFLTNRKWVFRAPTKGAKEFFIQARDFYGGRLVTYFIEEIIILIFVTILHLNEDLVKISAQFVVLVLNYVISKLFVFRKKDASEPEKNTPDSRS